MKAFTTHKGSVASLDRANVDTDQIIPKQFLKRIERTGFGQFLFYDWRYQDDGKTPNEQFELNQPQFVDATILVARQNFGSGSSREHAVWALDDYGFRAVIAPSFADIFYNNCFKNGLLPVVLAEAKVEQIFQNVAAHGRYELTIDLERCRVTDGDSLDVPFEVQASRRENLLRGLDEIGLTLQFEDKITQYEASRHQ